MIIHSKGEGGWGKSSLLKIFDEECADCASPITEALLFDPKDKGADWKLIMNRTVHAIGESYFPEYRIVSTSGSVPDNYGYSFGIEEVNDTSDNSYTPGRQVESSSQLSSRSGRTPDRADQNLLTPIFIKEFREAPKPEQLVWLVDTVDQLDDDTVIWFRKIFKHIALGELQNLILVLAGRDQLNASRDWGNRIKQTRLGPLDIPAVVDLLEQGGWDGTKQERRDFAKQLIYSRAV